MEAINPVHSWKNYHMRIVSYQRCDEAFNNDAACQKAKRKKKKCLKTTLVIAGIEGKQLRFCCNFYNKMSPPVNDTRCLLLTIVDINVHPGLYGPRSQAQKSFNY